MVDADGSGPLHDIPRLPSAQSLWGLPTRLPTPAPSENGHAAPNPQSPFSSTFLAPPSLSIQAIPKSISLSSLSGWDESGSRFISALPSPSVSVAGSTFSDAGTNEDGGTPPPASSGSKTNSFFSTSFEATPPPSLLPQRSSSVSVRGKHGDASALGVSTNQGGNHPRSVSAERSPPGRADTANSIFFTRGPTPAPPPSLRMTARDEPEAGPSKPRRVSFHSPTKESAPLPPQEALVPTRYRAPPISPAPRRRIILLDEPETSYTSSPAPSPTKRQPSPPKRSSSPPLSPSPQPHLHHIHRETISPLQEKVKPGYDHKAELAPGVQIHGEDVTLTLVRPVGEGAFSAVWLATDDGGALGAGGAHSRRPSESVARRKDDSRMAGLVPAPRLPSSVARWKNRASREASIVLDEGDGEGATSPAMVPVRVFAREQGGADGDVADGDVDGEEPERAGRVVAVKMLDRALCDANDRTRISFVREVEVLRHVHHPSIVSYLHSFTTPTHHCLVLEYLAGGELFTLLDDDARYARLSEPLLRRMFGELARAVGWMHGVALVHRDIKLENIILTCDPFNLPLSLLPRPLLKLTDFGLSRFIDLASPRLATRCGSESYAAPEIVMGGSYDGRQTDAWACGVVLYALATRVLPFDPPEGGRNKKEGRKAYLFRIAKGDYTWPKEKGKGKELATEGLKRVVGRLLVRDAAKRARVVDLWDEEWMKGPGAPAPPHPQAQRLVDGDSIAEVARQELI